jgi:hypothetical protein
MDEANGFVHAQVEMAEQQVSGSSEKRCPDDKFQVVVVNTYMADFTQNSLVNLLQSLNMLRCLC